MGKKEILIILLSILKILTDLWRNMKILSRSGLGTTDEGIWVWRWVWKLLITYGENKHWWVPLFS